MAKILIVAPTKATGGISSWVKNLKSNFSQERNQLFFVDNETTQEQIIINSIWKRYFHLVTKKSIDLVKILRNVNKKIKQENIDVLHITSVASVGIVRDYMVARLCIHKNVKSIIQFRCGSIPNIFKYKIYSYLFLKTLEQYNRIWILDSKTFNILSKYPKIKEKLKMIPNPIEFENNSMFPDTYKKIVFAANLIESKGIIDLVKACTLIDRPIDLTIIGKGSVQIVSKIKEIATTKNKNWFKIMGQMDNQATKEIIRNADILCLPTYYPEEAFPISILEAMSFGKLVISTNRAAIPDMLTAADGSPCGILIQEKQPESIAEAIIRCYDHPQYAKNLCIKAFEKVKTKYQNSIVFQLYEQEYEKLTEH
jgi:glycosyltransferase involved in cell wall biosynthesis